MRSLGRRIFVPTAFLSAVVCLALAALAWESAREARALDRQAEEVRAATGLALALATAAQDEEHGILALSYRREAARARLAAVAERIARLSTEIQERLLPPRAAEVWRQYVDSRRTLVDLAGELEAATRRRAGAATALALEKWGLMSGRSEALLKSFVAYQLGLRDRMSADLERRRARMMAATLGAVMVGFLLSVALAIAMARAVVQPIVEMATAASGVSETAPPAPLAGTDRADEIGVLARAFNQMTERLVAANATLATSNAKLAEAVAAREEFISIASHELKTPMTPLALRVQLLRRAVERADGDGGREQVAGAALQLERHLSKLNRLVDNLLDVSRIASGHVSLELEDVSLAEAARDALDRMQDELASAGCEARLEEAADAIVRADRTRVDQVLTNLVGNAAKHAPGRPVVLRILDAGEDVVALEVEDGGPGISPADQERIFERFERAVPDRHVSGLGLGLFIARQIARAHGGELSVRSAPGRGATFTLRLPLRATASAAG